MEEINPERTLERTIRLPSTYALPPISSSIICNSIPNSLAIFPTSVLDSASTSTLIYRNFIAELDSSNAT